MKPRSSNLRNQALKLIEVLVVIVVLFVLSALLFPALANWKKHNSQHVCRVNLMNITMDYQPWPGEHYNKYPSHFPVTNSSVKELTFDGNALVAFQVMSNELNWPGFLHCPADTSRIAATNFAADLDGKISYFISTDAEEMHPQMFLSGDDNFEIGSVPAKSGLLEFSASTPISWRAARHKFAGNIGVANGSVQQTTSPYLCQLVQQTGVATNRLAIP